MEDIVDIGPLPAIEESEIPVAELIASDPPESKASVVRGRGDGSCVWSLTEEEQVSNLQKNWKSAFTLTLDEVWELCDGKKAFRLLKIISEMKIFGIDDNTFLAGVLGRLRTDPRLEIFQLGKIKESFPPSVLQLKMTSLDLAILMGDLKMVQTIVEKSSLLNSYFEIFEDVKLESFFNTPLHWAVVGGNSDIVDVLLEIGADVNVTNWFAQTPLHLACKLEGVEILLKLIKLDDVQRDPLHIAVRSADFAFIKKLSCHNSNARDKWNKTPLHYLASRPSDFQATNIMKYLAKDKTLDVKALDDEGCSAIYMAILYCSTELVFALLDSFKEHMRLNEICDERCGPPIQIAFEGGDKFKDIERALMECDSVKGFMERLFRDRQVYIDAANVILVGAALIASVTFASWLQPPLNYTSYSIEGYSSSIPTPSTSSINYVDVEHNSALRAFWIFNALSFYFAIATVVCGARSVLPRSHLFIKKNVEKLRTNLLVTSIFLACSVLFVIIAFALAGTIVLTPLLKYQWYMIVPTIVGGMVCIISLVFLVKSIVVDEFKTNTQNHLEREELDNIYFYRGNLRMSSYLFGDT